MSTHLQPYLNLIRWDRPAGWALLLWPTLSALWIASHGFPGWHLLAVFVAGTILMRSAGCCVNDVADRDFDRHVKRTANRPVTSGQVSPRQALALGAALALVAFGLVLTTNRSAVLWSFAALAVAVVYPYTKRVLSMPQAVLGVAFSFGIPMAFAAVQSRVPLLAWLLLASNLLWVLAYDTVYAMVDRDDDIRLNIHSSAMTLGRFDVAAVTAFNAVHMATWLGLLLVGRSLGALAWAGVAVGAAGAVAHAAWQFGQYKNRSREGCFAAFKSAHWLGFCLFIATVFSRI
jgi:4-hydroxybenzoate polyprenyltransferase